MFLNLCRVVYVWNVNTAWGCEAPLPFLHTFNTTYHSYFQSSKHVCDAVISIGVLFIAQFGATSSTLTLQRKACGAPSCSLWITAVVYVLESQSGLQYVLMVKDFDIVFPGRLEWLASD